MILKNERNLLEQKLKNSINQEGLVQKMMTVPENGHSVEEIRLLNSKIASLSKELNSLNVQLNDIHDRNQILEKKNKDLIDSISFDQEEKLRLISVEPSPGSDFFKLKIQKKEEEISKLKQQLNILESTILEKNQLIGIMEEKIAMRTYTRDLNEKSSRAKNFIELSHIQRTHLFNAQSDIAQKDLIINSLQQKVAYLKQKETKSKQVNQNANQFPKNFFESFQSGRKRK